MNNLRKTNTNSYPYYFTLFDDFMQSSFPEIYRERTRERKGIPAVNIHENDHQFEIDIVAPGFGKENFDIDLKDNVLTIKGKMEKQEGENKKYYHHEYCCSQFERSFTIPDNIETEKIDARYNQGILEIVLPKVKEEKTNHSYQITVK